MALCRALPLTTGKPAKIPRESVRQKNPHPPFSGGVFAGFSVRGVPNFRAARKHPRPGTDWPMHSGRNQYRTVEGATAWAVEIQPTNSNYGWGPRALVRVFFAAAFLSRSKF